MTNFFVWFVVGMFGYFVLGTYLIFSVRSCLLFIVIVCLYPSLLYGWRLFALGLMPLPFLFLKIGLGIVVYFIVMYGVMLFI